MSYRLAQLSAVQGLLAEKHCERCAQTTSWYLKGAGVAWAARLQARWNAFLESVSPRA